MNFEGRWLARNGEEFLIARLERAGEMCNEGDEIYTCVERPDLRWDRNGDAIREEKSVYKYYETQWNRAPEYDLMERTSEKDKRK